MQSFQNSQVVKGQQVEEFARRPIFPISQAAVAVSENFSLHINYFKCHKTHFSQSMANIGLTGGVNQTGTIAQWQINGAN